MPGRLRKYLAVMAGLLISVPVVADEAVPADPWELIHLAREVGPAEVGRDSMRDPRISGQLGGIAYHVDFYGCWLGRNCEAILFQARLGREDWKPAPAEIASWNAEKLYGRAWIDDEGRAVLDQPLPMHAGLPRETLAAGFVAWRRALAEFSEHIEFK